MNLKKQILFIKKFIVPFIVLLLTIIIIWDKSIIKELETVKYEFLKICTDKDAKIDLLRTSIIYSIQSNDIYLNPNLTFVDEYSDTILFKDHLNHYPKLVFR